MRKCAMMSSLNADSRFNGIEPFKTKVWLSSPTMHGEEQTWVDDAIRTNWVSTVGANINEIEKQIAEYVKVKYAVALSAGTAALHLATKLAGERLYGQVEPNMGTLQGHRVFASDMTFDASINPIAYEDGEAIFIDTEYDTWNMDPAALDKAFDIYPDPSAFECQIDLKIQVVFIHRFLGYNDLDIRQQRDQPAVFFF